MERGSHGGGGEGGAGDGCEKKSSAGAVGQRCSDAHRAAHVGEGERWALDVGAGRGEVLSIEARKRRYGTGFTIDYTRRLRIHSPYKQAAVLASGTGSSSIIKGWAGLPLPPLPARGQNEQRQTMLKIGSK